MNTFTHPYNAYQPLATQGPQETRAFPFYGFGYGMPWYGYGFRPYFGPWGYGPWARPWFGPWGGPFFW